MRNLVKSMIGEAAAVPSPEAVEQDLGTDTQDGALEQGQSPSVDLLMGYWEKGQKTEAAIRVLDSLDSYQQFVEFLFRIGQEGALELGGIMDELTSEEKSPHEFDVVPSTALTTKYGKGPRPGTTHGATGESLMKEALTQAFSKRSA